MNTSRHHARGAILIVGIALLISSTAKTAQESERSVPVNQVLEWNQIFIDTLIATNTANSSSQRLGAIVHTAIFDAYNGIERTVHANLRRQHRASWRVAPGSGDCCGIHRARRHLPVLVAAPTGGPRRPLCGVTRSAE